MDKKENELKEVLGNSFSQDDIEKKLKEKIKKASKDREMFEKKSKITHNKPANKDFITKKMNLNLLLFILLAIMGILIFVTIYLFNSSKPVKKSVSLNSNKEEKSYFKRLYNSKNYDTYKCYSFKYGNIALPIKECKENLDIFLEKNKNANRFEIVPLISQNDTVIYKQIEENLKEKPKEFQDKVKEYLNIGLSSERILESVWYIKKVLGEDTIVTSSQYYVKSDKNNEQGVIIRAYH
ncbi:hypothetical protein [Halarcobacter anaerophilus]|uniref:Uncharacterized protein n=1 Tax=Halarcobacter anaerophilus TaxID=877500 RepID=A0A4Q0XYI8_9BACT|nr:hypothetical protein [Halarcobacter anaerophilus]QDF28212.1 hypothetical protein AANAER_0718 [Halarcobacter anaerophilus]RXJ61369.1 hypothetical protein CRV06_13875 [Halarcobacter anaerophilus]